MIRKLCFCLSLLAISTAHAAEAPDCYVGSYRLNNGSVIDIAPSDSGTLRWRRLDGTTGALHRLPDGKWRSTAGWSDKPDGITASFDGCTGGVKFDDLTGARMAFEETNTTFTSHGTQLVGRLVLPKGQDKVPVVVLVHGSENDSALIYYSLQRMLPAEGIGAFVYDKRGTGKSGGVYTQDFNVLADDAVTAMREAKRLAGPRLGRIGYQGGSEGGWVAPLAANRAPVDFVIVSFGLAVNVIDEDQQSVDIQLRERGYSPAEIAQAKEVAAAAENVFASNFTSGYRELDALRAKYKQARWYKDLRGDFTWMLLPHSEAELRAMAPKYQWHTPFHYDPMPTLRAEKAPELWILGGEDYDAPSAETSRRIKQLIAQGRPFTLALYPHAEHGMTLFDTAPNGDRISTRYAAGYFTMMRDFARDGRLNGPYGDAELTKAAN